MKVLKTVLSLAFLLALNSFSFLLVSFLHIKFPAPIIGMLCLALLLYLKIIPIEYVEDGANLLLDNMSLLFIPVIVGATVYFGLFAKNAFAITLIFIVSTIAIIWLTGLSVKYILMRKIMKKRKGT